MYSSILFKGNFIHTEFVIMCRAFLLICIAIMVYAQMAKAIANGKPSSKYCSKKE